MKQTQDNAIIITKLLLLKKRGFKWRLNDKTVTGALYKSQ